MFDARETFPLTSRLLGELTIKWPTDDQWNAYTKKVRAESGPSGEAGLRKTKSIGADEAAKELTDQIVTERDGDPLDGPESALLVSKLLAVGEVHTKREGGKIRSRLIVWPANTKVEIECNDPTVKQLRDWANKNTDIGQRGETAVATSNYVAGEVFYDAVNAKPIDGYADGSPIPNVHKDALAQAVYALINKEEGGLPF